MVNVRGFQWSMPLFIVVISLYLRFLDGGFEAKVEDNTCHFRFGWLNGRYRKCVFESESVLAVEIWKEIYASVKKLGDGDAEKTSRCTHFGTCL